MIAPKTAPSPTDILALLPQQPPFRFVDQILAVDAESISGRYTFRNDEFFYAGHFPGRPVTPGVILLEAMCQVGVVAHGIYLFGLDSNSMDWKSEARHWTTFFADGAVDFHLPVYPGETVEIRAERIFWRRQKLKSKIRMYRNGACVAEAVASGIGVKND